MHTWRNKAAFEREQAFNYLAQARVYNEFMQKIIDNYCGTNDYDNINNYRNGNYGFK